ncbi:MAG: glycine cleavage system protein GcvH [Actinobacteria bacterium]|nr:glycine cleavage system protein GcvH [Actinomycetota bacterium]NDH81102.1 glycine cleavage system protein GcvH [Actinomycetota bacterium]NDH99417.1 glycine cleavage system protein GcvH [Actinomycetota bacterium]
MSQIPDSLQYTKEHEWVANATSPLTYRVGITDYAQAALGDIVYVQLPKVGESITADKVCGEVESTKSVSEIYSPVTGKVSAINADLTSSPETINTDPYGAGWLFEVTVDSEPQNLLSASDYAAITA